MKLSEAIKLGSMAHQQTGRYHSETRRKFRLFGPKVIYATCALGAASVAKGVEHLTRASNRTFIDTLERFWPVLKTQQICPVCDLKTDLWSILDTHLGASPYGETHQYEYGHGWTREAIADWVATIEPQEALVEAEAVQQLKEMP